MKNADMPAMPVIDDEQSFPLDMDRYGSKSASAKFAFGLTKREMMAMHIMTGLCSKYGAAFDTDTVQDAIRMADFLLAELERTK